MCCQDVADIDEQTFEGKKRFTFMFPVINCMQAFYKYFHFLPTALFVDVSFCKTTLSSHLILFYKLGDNHQIFLQILAKCLKITCERVKARSPKVKLLHRCFPKVSLIVAQLLKHY